MVYPKGYMNAALFMHIVYELPASTTIVPFYRGESLLHPLFNIYMKHLQKFSQVQLATNGDYLTPQNQQAILDTCSFISISLHKFMYPSDTKFLSFLYDALGGGVETQISIIDTLVPAAKKKSFIKAWHKNVDRVRIYKTHSVNGFGCMDTPKTTVSCNKPFEDMVVYWNGRVGLCNHDWNNGVILGDLNMQNISTVWNDGPYKEIRELHKSGNRQLVNSCKDCSFDNKLYGEMIKMESVNHGR